MKRWCVASCIQVGLLGMDVCLLCRCVLKSASQRRKLHGDSMMHVVAVLHELVGEHVWTPATETLFHLEEFLCRPCVRSLEKPRKLKDELQAKESEIRKLLDSAMDEHGLFRWSFSTPVRKRSAAAVAANMDSPTGTAVQHAMTLQQGIH